MRSLTLLLALVAIASGFTHWGLRNKAAVNKVQLQADLIIHASQKQNVDLLYDLIPFGQDIDQYLKNHPLQVNSVSVKLAQKMANGKIKAIAEILEISQNGEHKGYMSKLELSPSGKSPTGYTMSKGFICADSCLENALQFGLLDE